MKTLALIPLKLLLIAACLVGTVSPSVASNKPSIIIIYTDDQGYGDASCLNAKAKFQTPNIDRLAREGLTFTDGHCSDTVCTPSRYGLLTGRYSWRTELKRGVFGAERTCLIPDNRMTIASLLRKQGYRTAMVGKWHLGMDFPGTYRKRDWKKPTRDMPLDKGFDYYWGIPASMNYGVLAWFDGRFPETPPTLFTRKKPNKIALSDYRIKPPYQMQPTMPKDLEVAADFVDSACLTRFTDQAISWLTSHQQQHADTPFFLYLPLTSPHKPVIPLERFRGQGKAGAYGEFMIETDYHVGRILDYLDQAKLSKNTLVIFTSDNGPENTWKARAMKFQHQSNGIYREGKRSIYEGGHRVPFILRWPAQVKAGSQWTRPVCQTDILATLSELVGQQLPANAGEDSVSFLNVLSGEKTQPQRPPMIHHSIQGRYAIRSGEWKLVMETRKTGRELYNLASDPRESKNVLEQHPEIARELTEKITAIVNRGRTTTGPVVKNNTPWWPDLTWIKKTNPN
ncbi:MAG TPA: arylsulfatase [Planctomycetaceae bacterium]|nr:arylsulfatase [Planctomycetaceae bacterium]